MRQLLAFVNLRYTLSLNAVRVFLAGSKLRVTVVTSAAFVFWLLMFGMFMDVFTFMDRAGFREIRDVVSQYLFAFFFAVLLVMMTISNAIISYTSFYRDDETSFLLSLPVRAGRVFVYKSLESILFSAWGMATLVVPLILAYGITSHAPWYFYIFGLLLAGIFIGLPMELGALIALFVPIMIPRKRKLILVGMAAAAVIGLTWWGLSIVGGRPNDLLTETGLKMIMDRLAFSTHWAIPSYWVSEGMLSSAQGAAHQAAFDLLLLLSNVLFVGMIGAWLGGSLYLRTWALAHRGQERRRIGAADVLFDRAMAAALSFLPLRFQLLVLKDMKTFLRDPVQWSQVVLFFGLLALYIVNLPRFGATAFEPFWQRLISLLNLGATCLVLSTLTSRFVYPQLSLEGRRIWVIGMLPMSRSTILWGKFFFAGVGSLVLSAALILLSDVMLKLPAWKIAIHLTVVVCSCCGLNGLAVGLGAVYPNMRSDDPSKIVSSFGGTLNLVCSICFVIMLIMLAVIPLTRDPDSPDFLVTTLVCMGMDGLLAAVACGLPMTLGLRAFERMEF